MHNLRTTSEALGYKTHFFPQVWPNQRIFTIDKIKITSSFLNLGSIAPNDIVLFTDAYDVMVLASPSELISKFMEMDCDILVNSEVNCFPERADEKEEFNKLNPTKRNRYLNSGCYIGYAYAIKKMNSWIEYQSSIVPEEYHAGDQMLMQDYFLKNHDKPGFMASYHIKIDVESQIFFCMNSLESSQQELKASSARNFIDILPNLRFGVHQQYLDLDQNDKLILGNMPIMGNLFSQYAAMPLILHSNGRKTYIPLLAQIGNMILDTEMQNFNKITLIATSSGQFLSVNSKTLASEYKEFVLVDFHDVDLANCVCIISRHDYSLVVVPSCGQLSFRPNGLVSSGAEVNKKWELFPTSNLSEFKKHGRSLLEYFKIADRLDKMNTVSIPIDFILKDLSKFSCVQDCISIRF